MNIPKGYEEEKQENISIYHYVEILVTSFNYYMKERIDAYDITLNQLPFLVKLYQEEQMTQQDLAKFFNKTEGYTAKLLRQFEDDKLITRKENPDNRRKKIVTLTKKGKKQSEDLIKDIDNWEKKVTNNNTENDMKKLKRELYTIISLIFEEEELV